MNPAPESQNPDPAYLTRRLREIASIAGPQWPGEILMRAAAEIESLRAALAAREEEVDELTEWAWRAARVIEDLEGPSRDWDYDESRALNEQAQAISALAKRDVDG